MYFGIILYIKTFLQDFEFYFGEMDKFAEQSDLPALNDKFNELIKFHVYIKEYAFFPISIWFSKKIEIDEIFQNKIISFSLSERLGAMMRGVIFVTFTPCILSICGSLLRGQSVSNMRITFFPSEIKTIFIFLAN